MRAMRWRIVVIALALGGLAPLRAGAQESDPAAAAEAMRRQAEELGRTWAVRYDVTEAEYAEAKAAVPARLEWATCSKKDSPLRVSCLDRSAVATVGGCRAAAIAVLSERAATLGRGRALPARTTTEMACATRRVTLSVQREGATELKEKEGGVSGVPASRASAPAAPPDSTTFDKPDIANRKEVAERLSRVYPSPPARFDRHRHHHCRALRG